VIWREPLAHSGAHARDIAKNACFQLPLVEAVLHQITATHDALQLAVLDDRQVTTPELERAHLAIRHPPAGRQRVRPAQLTLSDPRHGEQPTADRVVSAE